MNLKESVYDKSNFSSISDRNNFDIEKLLNIMYEDLRNDNENQEMIENFRYFGEKDTFIIDQTEVVRMILITIAEKLKGWNEKTSICVDYFTCLTYGIDPNFEHIDLVRNALNETFKYLQDNNMFLKLLHLYNNSVTNFPVLWHFIYERLTCDFSKLITEYKDDPNVLGELSKFIFIRASLKGNPMKLSRDLIHFSKMILSFSPGSHAKNCLWSIYKVLHNLQDGKGNDIYSLLNSDDEFLSKLTNYIKTNYDNLAHPSLLIATLITKNTKLKFNLTINELIQYINCGYQSLSNEATNYIKTMNICCNSETIYNKEGVTNLLSSILFIIDGNSTISTMIDLCRILFNILDHVHNKNITYFFDELTIKILSRIITVDVNEVFYMSIRIINKLLYKCFLYGNRDKETGSQRFVDSLLELLHVENIFERLSELLNLRNLESRIECETLFLYNILKNNGVLPENFVIDI